ncbi:hypothetical protein J5N97_027127 [Dioscorea zingiberensis]|uniref:Uncharacterized protein n=1 Tax=Dioscorea zingiberensis TaxID=325984 RepID=A0A9D5H7C0_9LILI|nr:hypothetical protein J5N97_027127 [Dioscorea zingiberensis]
MGALQQLIKAYLGDHSILTKTRGSGRSNGRTNEGKKKRSEDNNSEALLKKSKLESSSSSLIKVLEHPQIVLLSKMQEANITLCDLVVKSHDDPIIVMKWMDLQQTVNVLFDSSKALESNPLEC